MLTTFQRIIRQVESLLVYSTEMMPIAIGKTVIDGELTVFPVELHRHIVFAKGCCHALPERGVKTSAGIIATCDKIEYDIRIAILTLYLRNHYLRHLA